MGPLNPGDSTGDSTGVSIPSRDFAPAKVTGITFVSSTADSINFKWKKPREHPLYPIDGYEIQMAAVRPHPSSTAASSSEGSGRRVSRFVDIAIAPGDIFPPLDANFQALQLPQEFHYTAKALEPNTHYCFRLRSHTSQGGWGSYSSASPKMKTAAPSKPAEPWTCAACTYINENPPGRLCDMCHQKNPNFVVEAEEQQRRSSENHVIRIPMAGLPPALLDMINASLRPMIRGGPSRAIALDDDDDDDGSDSDDSALLRPAPLEMIRGLMRHLHRDNHNGRGVGPLAENDGIPGGDWQVSTDTMDYDTLSRLFPSRAPTASRSAVARLPVQTISEKFIEQSTEENRSCLVCLEEFAVHDSVKMMPCLHRFHGECIDKWLSEGANACPVCKTSI
jgi:hypothetical protein